MPSLGIDLGTSNSAAAALRGGRPVIVPSAEDITLGGDVPRPEERELAEFDAWCVFDVDDVVDEIAVAPIKPTGRL